MKNIFLHPDHPEYQLFASCGDWITQLVKDIRSATHYIYIETFRLSDDITGRTVCEALMEQAANGIDIKLIVDSWGTRKTSLFTEMEKKGISIRYFKKLVLTFNWFGKNHKRNHRKIITIDDRIAYIGSANFSKYSLSWRESVLRMESNISKIFKSIFLENYKIYKKKIKNPKYYKTINHGGFKIIRETPSIIHQKSRNYFMRLIDDAKETITIVTPYFVTGKSIREKLIKAVKRGIKVRIIIPKNSDVRSVDFLRDLFLGPLYLKGIDLQMFKKGNLHAKLVLIDDTLFSIGSTNFDYRSFRYMHEINLSGNHPVISSLISEYMEDTLTECTSFNYLKWALRPLHQKLIGMLLYPIRKLI